MNTKIINVILSMSLLVVSSLIYAEEKPIVFKPPKLGAPTTRIGGGTRGIENNVPKLQLFAPEQTALTNQASPKLYWHISQPSQYPVEIAIVIDNQSKPIFEKKLGILSTAGLQTINLSDLGINLTAGQDYRWSVALITDEQQRSNDIFASAVIRYEPIDILNDTNVMAEKGYWYDVISSLINTQSSQLHDVLKQAGIDIK